MSPVVEGYKRKSHFQDSAARLIVKNVNQSDFNEILPTNGVLMYFVRKLAHINIVQLHRNELAKSYIKGKFTIIDYNYVCAV